MQIRRRSSSFWKVWGSALVSVGALVAIEQGTSGGSTGD